VALAAALGAERCEIYSDVDGIYSADPSMVGDAFHLPELSYPVMQEMSAAGAKVLNAHAVQFAKEKQIAIYARSTFSPGRESIIRVMPAQAITGIQAVVSEQGVTRVRFNGENATNDFNQAVAYLEEEQVQIKEIYLSRINADSSQSRAGFVVSSNNLYGWEKIRAHLKKRIGDGIFFDEDLSALSIIGEGLTRNSLVLMETLALLNEKGISVSGIATTSFRISLLIPKNWIEQSVRLCHDHWIGAMR